MRARCSRDLGPLRHAQMRNARDAITAPTTQMRDVARSHRKYFKSRRVHKAPFETLTRWRTTNAASVCMSKAMSARWSRQTQREEETRGSTTYYKQVLSPPMGLHSKGVVYVNIGDNRGGN